jgi:hypothetical protein
VLGLAVRDTCVVPFDGGSLKTGEGGNRRRGYAFAASPARTATDSESGSRKENVVASSSPSLLLLDPWLHPYPRVTVPTFDLSDGEPAGPPPPQPSNRRKQRQAGGEASSDSASGGTVVLATTVASSGVVSAATAASVVVTNDHVLVWTPNGRLPLSPAAYSASARCLLAGKGDTLAREIVVPLFDVILPSSASAASLSSSSSSARRRWPSRKQMAIQRCREWCLFQRMQQPLVPRDVVAAPVVLDPTFLPLPSSTISTAENVDDDENSHQGQHCGGNGQQGTPAESATREKDDDDATSTSATTNRTYDDCDVDVLQQQLEQLHDEHQQRLPRRPAAAGTSSESVAGNEGSSNIALVGWHWLSRAQRRHATDLLLRHYHHRRRLLRLPRQSQSLLEMRSNADVLIVLKTTTLAQFVDASTVLDGDLAQKDGDDDDDDDDDGGGGRVCARPVRVLVTCYLPTKWARSHKAFVLPLVSPFTTQKSREQKQQSEKQNGEGPPPSKRTRREDDLGETEDDGDRGESVTPKAGETRDDRWGVDEDGCIDLSPPRWLSLASSKVDGTSDRGISSHPWFRDDSPIVEGCTCTTCQNHSRAYLYHLVCANELLSEVLLFIHNLHHFLGLVDAINQRRDWKMRRKTLSD